MADWKTVRFDPSYEEKIDPEILPLCDALNTAGIATTQSCCGHGYRWPCVWFEHSTDERIEDLARFLMKREQGAYRAYFSVFQKEIVLDGYSWSLEVHLNNVYADTPVNAAMREAASALDQVARMVQQWAGHNSLTSEEMSLVPAALVSPRIQLEDAGRTPGPEQCPGDLFRHGNSGSKP